MTEPVDLQKILSALRGSRRYDRPVASLEDEIRAFVDDIAVTKDARSTWPRISEYVARGEPDVLLHVTRALIEERDAAQGSPWVRDQVLDEIERVLALTPGLNNASTLARILKIPRVTDQRGSEAEAQRTRSAASLLASAQDRNVLTTLLKELGRDPACSELLACWLQESIVRGESFHEERDAIELWRRLSNAGHPLAVLPLDLDEVEMALRGYVPRYELGTSRTPPPRRPSRPLRRPRLVHDRDGSILTHDEMVDAERLLAISSAVRGWKDSSNGRIETRLYSFGRRCLEGEVTPEFLRNLGVRCVQTRPGDEDPVLSQINFGRVVNLLFAAAANGGAYGGARRGAYGRLEAWKSIAGLAGAPLSAGFERVIRVAEASSWLEIDVSTATWFDRVAWHFGLIVLSGSGSELAVLAATDTD